MDQFNFEFAESMFMEIHRSNRGELIDVEELASIKSFDHDGVEITFRDKRTPIGFMKVLKSWDIYTYSAKLQANAIQFSISSPAPIEERHKFYSLIVSFMNNDFKLKSETNEEEEDNGSCNI